jgi:hypothetical protein
MIRRYFYILFLLFSLIRVNAYAQASGNDFASSSVLSSGQWFRIAVMKDGIYRIDFSGLKQLGLANPSQPRIFANNFGQLSYLNNDPRPDDLKEIALMLVTGTDGIFNDGDYLLFYGQGTGRWKFNTASGDYSYTPHNYSDTAFYFLTSGPAQGKSIGYSQEQSGTVNYSSSQSDALFVHEQEDENLIKSGREWFQPVSSLKGVTINPGFTDLILTEKIKTRIRLAGRSSAPTMFRLYEGETVRKSIQIPAVNLYSTTGTYAQIVDSVGTMNPLSSSPTYEIRFFNNGEISANGWIDYVWLQARRRSTYTGGTLFLRDSRSAGPGMFTEFSVVSQTANPSVWDVTDPFNPGRIQYTKNGESLKFQTATGTLRTFVLFGDANVLQPVIKPGVVPNQNLHGSGPADMIIITHPLFRSYAEKLADFHHNESGLVSQVVSIGEIYNEFSGGIPDIAAIRNFVRMKYLRQKGSSKPLKYLLLFGDGSYENKTLPTRNPNFIPTYQSQNSNIIVSSFTSDDFYGLLDDGEGEADGTEDIGIGRFPVSDTAEAGIIFKKIVRYLDPSNTGDWKNVICLTADDEDGNTHMSDAEGLSTFLKDSVPVFNVDKIYLDAFRQVTSVNGQSYPDVVTAINNRINSGCLVFNYTGHGNEDGFAHERVVRIENINSWTNGAKLPLFITATCEFSRFDDIDINMITREMTEKASAGEKVLLNENGGGIALMSTTRVVYSAPNYFLNKNIFNFAFDQDSSGNPLRLGDIIRLAKNNSGSGPNKRNFSLLGDPALRLAYPWHGKVVTDSINHIPVSGTTDSLKALTIVTVSGHIEDFRGREISDFNGVVSPLIYDKTTTIKTLANDGGQSFKYILRNNILFSGKTTARNGKFKFTFIVPRDIDYSFGQGKISYYANDSSRDMNGYFSDIIVGGFAQQTGSDTTGPVIRLFMNDTLFREGGITDNSPWILALIEDTGGINTTGTGIGHDLTSYLDNDRKNTFLLNNYFENDFDNYIKGRIVYELNDLTEGNHTITLKAWDNYNNSSEQSITFVVESGGKFILKNLVNYPNPIIEGTRITAEHNRPDEKLEVIIRIFDMSGRIIRMIRTSTFTTGYQLSPITWDGNTEGGKRVGRGIYPYNITVTTPDGEKAVASGRMIIL